ncbi:hypothetical protein ACLBKU_12110 [Erythrobacter sp. NE805]|uniref:hypothetical protein n=1 Tax=Erythrobacter sp. NE805 TaxID=3389875 RepID=UPI00396B3950
MHDPDDLARQYTRVAAFSRFEPEQRIWWIYLRGAVERWFERRGNEDPRLREAYDRVKSFPEHLPDELQAWHQLREAVKEVLSRES